MNSLVNKHICNIYRSMYSINESVNEDIDLEKHEDSSLDVDAIKDKMEKAGYEYDDLDSDEDNGYIVFFSENGVFPSGGFKSWEEVKDWIDNVVFDDERDEYDEAKEFDDDDKKEYAYHCTNINPIVIKKDGFLSGVGSGFTHRNQLEHFYKDYLPSNPAFVSGKKESKWDDDTKYCIKIDATGLPKYPDFGHLLDYGANFDEDEFYWGDESIDELRARASDGNKVAKKLINYLENETEEYNIDPSRFTGELSNEILGTYVLDGDDITADRILSHDVKEDTVDDSDEIDDGEDEEGTSSKMLKNDKEKLLMKTAAKDGVKHGLKVAQKFAEKKAGAKLATTAGLKAAGKALKKTALKKIPVVGAALGFKYAHDRIKEGDLLGAAGEAASGLASCVPGIGSLASLGIDGVLTARDFAKMKKDKKEIADVKESDDKDEYEDYPLASGDLAKCVSYKTAENIIYDAVFPYTKGIFHDDSWEGIHKIFYVLKHDLNLDVNSGVRNDDYYQHGYSLDQSSKVYQFDAKFRNVEGKKFKINGQIIAAFCGTEENPMSKYDITFQLF